MTTVLSSSQLCDACHSSGTACCSHDFTCLRLSCTHQVPDGTTAGLSLSLARDGQTSLHEFQFFGSNDTATGLLRSTHDVTPMVEPVIKYQENPRSKRPLTLDIYSSTTSSSNHPSGSSPMEVSIMGQMISSANAVSLSGKMLMDASTKSDKGVPNTGTSSNGDDVAEGEARILRYKEKKAKRNFERQIRYPSRKTNAEMRPRVRGRFTKS